MSEPISQEGLALGQRTGIMILVDGPSWTDEELALITSSGSTILEVIRYWISTKTGEETLNAALGSVGTAKEQEAAGEVGAQEEASASAEAPEAPEAPKAPEAPEASASSEASEKTEPAQAAT